MSVNDIFNDIDKLKDISGLDLNMQYARGILWIKNKFSSLNEATSKEAEAVFTLAYTLIWTISQSAFNNKTCKESSDYFELFKGYYDCIYGKATTKTNLTIELIGKSINDIKKKIIDFECSIAKREKNSEKLIDEIYDDIANLLFLPKNDCFYNFLLNQTKKIDSNKFCATNELAIFFLFEIIFKFCRNKVKIHKNFTLDTFNKHSLPEFRMYFILKYLISYLEHVINYVSTGQWTNFIDKWPNILSTQSSNSSSIAIFDKTKKTFLSPCEAAFTISQDRLKCLILFQSAIKFSDQETNKFMHYDNESYKKVIK